MITLTAKAIDALHSAEIAALLLQARAMESPNGEPDKYRHAAELLRQAGEYTATAHKLVE